METRGEAGGTDQPRRVLDESVVVQDAEQFGFDIGRAVEWIHQQSARARIQRQGHGIDGEIPPAQVFNEGGGGNHGRLAGFLIVLGARHADFGAHVSRQPQV